MGGFTFRSLGPVGNNKISLKFFFWTDLSQYPLFWKPFLMNSLCIRFHQPLSLPIFRAICFRLRGNKSSRPHLLGAAIELRLSFLLFTAVFSKASVEVSWEFYSSTPIYFQCSSDLASVNFTSDSLRSLWAYSPLVNVVNYLPSIISRVWPNPHRTPPQLILSNYHYLHFSLSQLLTSLMSAYRLIFVYFISFTNRQYTGKISNPGSFRINMWWEKNLHGCTKNYPRPPLILGCLKWLRCSKKSIWYYTIFHQVVSSFSLNTIRSCDCKLWL